MGDRAHLLAPTITIETSVEDLVGVIESEELSEVVLVGHSFGGVPISGVADRIAERIAKLIYLDAVVLERAASRATPRRLSGGSLPAHNLAVRGKDGEHQPDLERH